MLLDRRDMSVALRCIGFVCNGCRPRRNDDRGVWVLSGDSGFAIISAVSRHRHDVSIDLIEQVRYLGDFANIVRGQSHCDDLMRVGIPAPTRDTLDSRLETN
jgi:hypothetical protein